MTDILKLKKNQTHIDAKSSSKNSNHSNAVIMKKRGVVLVLILMKN